MFNNRVKKTDVEVVCADDTTTIKCNRELCVVRTNKIRLHSFVNKCSLYREIKYKNESNVSSRRHVFICCVYIMHTDVEHCERE